MRTPAALPAVAVALTALLAGCAGGPAPSNGPGTTGAAREAAEVFGAERIEELVGGVPHRAGKDLAIERLADGLVPPTNRWFSGLVFGPEPLPVYPLPLSVDLDDQGFTFGRPNVVTSEKTIMGTHAPTVQVELPDAPAWQVTAYDDASVTVSSGAGELLLAEGSPFLSWTADGAQDLTTGVAFTAAGDDLWTATVAGTEYGITGDGLKVSGTTVAVPDGARATWFPVPEGATALDLARLAADELVGTSVAYRVGTDTVTTTLGYRTAGGGDTAFVAMPHHGADATCTLGTYPSSWGTLTLCAGDALSWTSPLRAARTSLDVSELDRAERDELAEAVRADAAAPEPYPADTYFGGKALYRDAQLYSLATDLGLESEAAAVRDRVTTELLRWADPGACETREAFCFFYDESNRGVVGLTPSFGSDEFNDHHFHYGYFLYAAGVMAAEDPDLAGRLAPVLDLLAADIAASTATDQLPRWRNFDVYASHSWASGTSPFADGNNQESSSEAVLAWAGLTLWARASGNEALETQGTWLQALESQSARSYWTDFDATDPTYEGYGHSIAPLNFGGKRDYATWFSPEPAAALAILVLPLSPSSDHLADDPERVARNVAEGTASGGFDQTYGDYLIGYSALSGGAARERALEAVRSYDREKLDDGLTYSYLLAWVLAAG